MKLCWKLNGVGDSSTAASWCARGPARLHDHNTVSATKTSVCPAHYPLYYLSTNKLPISTMPMRQKPSFPACSQETSVQMRHANLRATQIAGLVLVPQAPSPLVAASCAHPLLPPPAPPPPSGIGRPLFHHHHHHHRHRPHHHQHSLLKPSDRNHDFATTLPLRWPALSPPRPLPTSPQPPPSLPRAPRPPAPGALAQEYSTATT